MAIIKGIDCAVRMQQIERMGVFTPRVIVAGAREVDRILTTGTERFNDYASAAKMTVYNLSCLLGFEADVIRAGVNPDSFSYELERRPMSSGEIHERYFRGYAVANGASWSKLGANDLRDCLSRTGFVPVVSGANVLALCGGYGYGLLKVDPFFSLSKMVLLDANAGNISRAIDIFDRNSSGLIAAQEVVKLDDTEIFDVELSLPISVSMGSRINLLSSDLKAFTAAVRAFRARTGGLNEYQLCITDARAGFGGIPFADETFNVILMLGDSEFSMSLDDMHRLMFETVRVLNRGTGVLILESNHIDRYVHTLEVIGGQFPDFRFGLVPLSGKVDTNMTVAVVGVDHFNTNMQ